MSFGKLYGFSGNARTMVQLAVAKENNLDIDFVVTNPAFDLTDEYLKLNPLGRVPTFVAADGWVLTEAIAIALYFTSQNKNTTLLGHSDREYAEIVRWMSFVNSEIQPSLASWFKPLLGLRPYDETNFQRAKDTVNKGVGVLETHLLSTEQRFVVSDTPTLADLFAASSLSRGFMYVFDKEWQGEHPCVTRWFRNVVDQPIWRNVVPEPVIVETAIKRAE